MPALAQNNPQGLKREQHFGLPCGSAENPGFRLFQANLADSDQPEFRAETRNQRVDSLDVPGNNKTGIVWHEKRYLVVRLSFAGNVQWSSPLGRMRVR